MGNKNYELTARIIRRMKQRNAWQGQLYDRQAQPEI